MFPKTWGEVMISITRCVMIFFACWCLALSAFAQTDSISASEPAFITVKQDTDGVHELCCHVPQAFMHSLKGTKFVFSVITTGDGGREIHHKQDGVVFANYDCQSKVRLRLHAGQPCRAVVEFFRSGQIVRRYETSVVAE